MLFFLAIHGYFGYSYSFSVGAQWELIIVMWPLFLHRILSFPNIICNVFVSNGTGHLTGSLTVVLTSHELVGNLRFGVATHALRPSRPFSSAFWESAPKGFLSDKNMEPTLSVGWGSSTWTGGSQNIWHGLNDCKPPVATSTLGSNKPPIEHQIFQCGRCSL